MELDNTELGIEPNTSTDILRFRVDQQSTLITMLKQRGDNTLVELTESRAKCELLTTQVDSVQERLKQGQTKLIQLEHKFSILAKNHEEMIRIKDEYKKNNQKLLAESKANTDCLKCKELEEKLTPPKMSDPNLKDKNEVFEISNSRPQPHKITPSFENELEELNKSYKQKEKHLLEKLTEWEERACKLESHCNKGGEEIKKLTLQIRQHVLDKENLEKELESCQNLLSSCEQELKHSQEREQQSRKNFRLRSDDVSRDVAVKQLSRELAETNEKLGAMEKEYSAYKKHSCELLAHERELNNKLRHVLD